MQNNNEIKFYENSQSLVSKLTSSKVTNFYNNKFSSRDVISHVLFTWVVGSQ